MKATLIIFRRRTVVRSQRWGWRLVAANGRIVATSGEGYTTKESAHAMGLSVVTGSYQRAKVVMPS